jgi:hypothetical protein
VPVLLLACLDHGDVGPGPRPGTQGASIDPAVQHLLLAARALGLGTVVPTLHTPYASEMKALLHIPATVETAALRVARRHTNPRDATGDALSTNQGDHGRQMGTLRPPVQVLWYSMMATCAFFL